MPNLIFAVDRAEALMFAAAPTIAFGLRITNLLGSEVIQSVALRCQIMIEASKRHYAASERSALRDLFGEKERWSQTLRSLLWSHTGTTVPEFTGSISVQLPVACTFDFNVAAAKYFYAASDGDDVPLCFQFSGTVFYPDEDGSLQIGQIGWDREARYRMPATIWREMMDHYYPNSAWLRLQRDVFERFLNYKQQHGFASWEQALDSLLPAEEEAAS